MEKPKELKLMNPNSYPGGWDCVARLKTHPVLSKTLVPSLNPAIDSEYSKYAYITLLLEYDNYLVGMLELRPFNNITIEGHILVLPEYWKQNIPELALKACKNYFKDNTAYRIFVVSAPASCKYMINVFERIGFKLEHVFNNFIFYDNKLQDLYFYRYDVV